ELSTLVELHDVRAAGGASIGEVDLPSHCHFVDVGPEIRAGDRIVRRVAEPGEGLRPMAHVEDSPVPEVDCLDGAGHDAIRELDIAPDIDAVGVVAPDL